MYRSVGFCLVVAIIGAVALAPSSAHAYIDPSTGSMVLQGIIAGAVGGLVAIKMYWQRIKTYLSRRDPSKLSEKGPSAPDE